MNRHEGRREDAQEASHGRGEAELKALAAEASVRFADASADEVLAWAAATFGDALAVACSMAADTVVAHLAAEHRPGIDVLFLQTGYHFPETRATRDALALDPRINVVDVVPRLTVAEQDRAHGAELFARDPGRCCAIRKVEPINRELAGYEAWVTGLRREDSPLRAGTPLVEWDSAHRMVKINPIAGWTFDEQLAYAADHQVPVNPLLTRGYPSIGCAPCTRPVAPGEDPRAGRWAGLSKTECGLHLRDDHPEALRDDPPRRTSSGRANPSGNALRDDPGARSSSGAPDPSGNALRDDPPRRTSSGRANPSGSALRDDARDSRVQAQDPAEGGHPSGTVPSVLPNLDISKYVKGSETLPILDARIQINLDPADPRDALRDDPPRRTPSGRANPSGNALRDDPPRRTSSGRANPSGNALRDDPGARSSSGAPDPSGNALRDDARDLAGQAPVSAEGGHPSGTRGGDAADSREGHALGLVAEAGTPSRVPEGSADPGERPLSGESVEVQEVAGVRSGERIVSKGFRADAGTSPKPAPADAATLSHLDELESEAIHIIREAVSELERPVLLFSGGKDSVVMLHLAAKAFWPGRVPFPVLHVDTGHNFPEVIDYRDRTVDRLGLRLVVASVQDYIDDGRLLERADGTRNPLQTQPLLDAIAEHRFDAVFGGGRRDEEKARAKERVVSLRDAFGQWDPRNQRPELWNLYNPRHRPGEHVRVFPLSNWTELDVWRYIEAEDIELPGLYYAHDREVFERDGMLLAVGPHSQPRDGETAGLRRVRYRTVGDMSCTGAISSDAATVAEVIAEVAATRITERGATRADDRLTEAAMEDRKKEGYF